VTGCGLGCGFCQNYQISRQGKGRVVGGAEFAAIALALQRAGAENINIVTGSHAVPAIVSALDMAREGGLDIPVLWNSSAYEGEAALELLRDRVDGYLPDLKTLDRRLGERLFQAPDYPGHARAAVLRMLSFQGELKWKAPRPIPGPPAGKAGAPPARTPAEGPDPAAPVLAKGVIVRHLVIPGCLESTREVIAWFGRHGRGRALLSLMTQYSPCPSAVPGDTGPRRRLSREEYVRVLGWLEEFGIDEGFCQEPAPASRDRDWLPDFDRVNPFSSHLSRPVWHWKDPVLRA
jgi:putative pyruvate formate lyase activating enzyme